MLYPDEFTLVTDFEAPSSPETRVRDIQALASHGIAKWCQLPYLSNQGLDDDLRLLAFGELIVILKDILYSESMSAKPRSSKYNL